MIELELFISKFAEALKAADGIASPFKHYRPGIGPHSEDASVSAAVQLLKLAGLEVIQGARSRRYPGGSRKTCDLVIPGRWAIEFKMLRPFGNNGREVEHWSENVLHPYPGNASAIGDCLKLLESSFPERKAVVVFGYEHSPALIELEHAVRSFEVIAQQVVGIHLSKRCEAFADNLIHPVHQQVRVYGWELLGQTKNVVQHRAT